jgi:phosphatidylinositol 3-kinase
MSEKRALTKLLKCVDWDEPLEVSAARQIIGKWAPVDVSDLIELLSTQFVATAPWVREFAVAGLAERASDGELLSYLLPLVQAVQYEKALPLPPAAAPLAAFLISRAARNAEIANFFAWYLAVERADERHGDGVAQLAIRVALVGGELKILSKAHEARALARREVARRGRRRLRHELRV